MIINFLLAIVWALLAVINAVLGAIPITIPAGVQNGIVYFASYIPYASGYIDLPGTFGALAFLLNFMVAWFTFKLFIYLYHLVVARQVPQKHALPAQQK